jgi:hypothetical protein
VAGAATVIDEALTSLSRANVCSYSAVVRFLSRHDAGPAGTWWAAVAEYPRAAPGVVRELLLSHSVVCDPLAAEQALAWARAHPAWTDDPAPLVIEDPTDSAR